jgi:hypothetical protein
VALADAGTDQQIAAESLFQEAKALIDQGKFAEACPKLVESARLAPAVGVLLNLGGCWEKVGRTASAWAVLNEAADRARAAGDASREKLARDRAAALAPKLPKLLLAVTKPASDLVIERDDSAVPAALWGQPLPVDPGEHRVRASAPGREPAVLTAVAREGETLRLEIPELARSKAGPSRASAHAAPDKRATGRIAAGIAVAGVGVVGLAVGAGTGAAALVKMKDARSHCASPDAGKGCDTTALSEQEAAKPLAIASTVGIVVGAAAVATGLTVWLTAPSSRDERPTARLTVSPSGVGLAGAW